MIQKILKVGTSLAVTIPKELGRKMGWKAGTLVEPKEGSQKGTVIIRPVVSPRVEVFDWTNDFIDKYREALEALAKK